MGFSAGGHLASTVATHFEDEESHPDFQILFYPVISMDPEYTHRGTHDNLLGKQPAKEEEDDFSTNCMWTAIHPRPSSCTAATTVLYP